MLFNAAASTLFLAGSAFAAVIQRDVPAVNETADAIDFIVDAPLAVSLGPFLSLIETIDAVPDSVVAAGDDAVHNWLAPIGASAAAAIPAPNAAVVVRSTDATNAADAADTTAAVQAVNGLVKDLECAAAVAAAIAGDVLPAAKLLKAKKLVKALGGVKKVAKLFLHFSSNRDEAIKEAGKTLVELVEILLGIDSIKKHCK
ncbi:hypothetical protein HMPREF1624_03378 [Sporothrix schenckii ATCC 58251]|uniref:Cell wall protein n=1 Tax=Sporothrix schenckii (strain ATCC 58251 / de Perez 2211183) TaxID=1391915 RepID=U7PWJ6_SPOS1|nr:hypothetical protein HMPREF1624_03378 [Sporothrix schenckii ATCC 58251]